MVEIKEFGEGFVVLVVRECCGCCCGFGSVIWGDDVFICPDCRGSGEMVFDVVEMK